jgi:hypothetical protein
VTLAPGPSKKPKKAVGIPVSYSSNFSFFRLLFVRLIDDDCSFPARDSRLHGHQSGFGHRDS